MTIQFKPQSNVTGDSRKARQGFGKRSASHPPTFCLPDDLTEASQYFATHGFAVLRQALTSAELSQLNTFFDQSQSAHPEQWGLGSRRKPHHRNQGLILSQPLLDHPELDAWLQHPGAYPLIEAALGGSDAVRWSEFNFREAPAGAGPGQMNFHHDAVMADRFTRTPYGPCDWVCSIHYLTDVDTESPAFCVVPGTHRFESLQDAYETLGDAYVEVPIYGEAGTAIIYDTAIYHTRLDGTGTKGRRTWHQYYARGGFVRSALPQTNRYVRPPSPPLTDWNLIPKRLAEHADPAMRLFFSHWNTAQCEWVARGYDPLFRAEMPRGEVTQ